MTDNFDKIANYLSTIKLTNDMFFHISVMIRHKDVEWFPKGKNNNARTIYPINIISVEELYDHKKLIIELCNSLKARAYINLVPKSYKKASSEALRNATESYTTENYKGLSSSWSKGVGKANLKEYSLYLIDIDEEDFNVAGDIKRYVYDNIVLELPSKTGLHILTKKIDRKKFEERFPEVVIKKDAMTILYSH